MEIKEILQGMVAIFGIIYTIRIYRQARNKYPVFRYDQHSTSNQADWRWRVPDDELMLKLDDDKESSRVHIQPRLLSIEKMCIIAGYISALFVIYIYGLFIVRNSDFPEYLIGLIFVLLSLALLNVGARASSIALYKNHLVIVENYAIFLKRQFIYKHSKQLSFKGKAESLFELTIDHTEPDYKLYIKRKYLFIFSTQKKLVLSANQSQGSWLVAGLEYWRDHAGLQKNNTS